MNDAVYIAGIIVTIVLAMGGTIWALLLGRIGRIEGKLDQVLGGVFGEDSNSINTRLAHLEGEHKINHQKPVRMTTR